MNRSTRTFVGLSLATALAFAGTWCRRAQSQPAAPAAAAQLPDAPPLADARENSEPGLTLAFQGLGRMAAAGANTDARTARLVALLVPAGTPPTPFLAPGPFKATFEGAIEQKLRGDFKFSFHGNGKVKLSINDKVVFQGDGDLATAEEQPATLKKGKNKVVVEYESPAQGDAALRMYWSGDDFPAEPVDPKLFTHSTTAKPIATGLRVREGRALFADLHCARCHTDPSITTETAKTGMPELAKDAPNLDEVGSRLNEKWMVRWISDPKGLRPDTSMPNLFHGKPDAAVQEGADVAAYLATLGGASNTPAAAPNANDAAAGGRLVARLGCIGCHTLPDKGVTPPDAHGRVNWHYVKAKYKPAALVAFLKQPEKHYAWIRMPNFRLSDAEATQLTAYLLANSKELEGDAPKGNADNGKKLVASAGCINCHQLKGDNATSAPALAAIPKDGWAKGCMAKDDAARGKAPDFGLTDGQRDALLAFAATDRSSLARDALPEFAERQVTELRCTACHTRDSKADVWDELAKEIEPLAKGDAAVDPESGGAAANGGGGGGANGAGGGNAANGEAQAGSGDQQRPPLTWVGEKLRPEWMSTFVAGKLDYKPRAWMLARMPGFPARAEGLAHGLALEHGYPTKSPERPAPDADLAAAGKGLVARNGGFGCVQCHGIANVPPLSPFEAPSINFKYVSERLNDEYFMRWMRDPIRIVPTTKMPKFATEGKTPLTDVLDGDADKQFNAIWNYLQAGRKIEHPEQEEAGK